MKTSMILFLTGLLLTSCERDNGTPSASGHGPKGPGHPEPEKAAQGGSMAAPSGTGEGSTTGSGDKPKEPAPAKH